MDLLTIGRISVDLYGQEIAAGLEDPQSFAKAVGGSPTNVAIGAAKYGHSTAVLTAVGNDSLGKFVVNELTRYGVSTQFVLTGNGATPVVIAGVKEADNPEFVFYRDERAPDTQIPKGTVSNEVVKEVKALWFTGSTLAIKPLSETVSEMLATRARKSFTIFDLDYRPSFWPDRNSAHLAINQALSLADVAIGNIEECRVATGLENEKDPRVFADALHQSGIEIAVVKGGPDGVLVSEKNGIKSAVPGIQVQTRCGLGAGDAFGAAFVHGLLKGWDLTESVRFANAAGAIVASRLLCSEAMPTEAEVKTLLASAS